MFIHSFFNSLQLTVEASNGRTPELTANVTVTVTIVRDDSRPSFDNLPYNDATVSENAAVGYEFYGKVQAQTKNLQVSQRLSSLSYF